MRLLQPLPTALSQPPLRGLAAARGLGQGWPPLPMAAISDGGSIAWPLPELFLLPCCNYTWCWPHLRLRAYPQRTVWMPGAGAASWLSYSWLEQWDGPWIRPGLALLPSWQAPGSQLPGNLLAPVAPRQPVQWVHFLCLSQYLRNPSASPSYLTSYPDSSSCTYSGWSPLDLGTNSKWDVHAFCGKYPCAFVSGVL